MVLYFRKINFVYFIQGGADVICVKCKKELPEGSVYCMFCGRKQTAAPRKQSRRPRGTGSISKYSGSRRKPWVARYKGVVVGLYETKAEAASALQKVVENPISDYYNITVAELYALWSEEHFKDLSPKGVQEYKTAFNKIKELHNIKFKSLRIKDMQDIVDELESAGLSVSSRNKVKNLFSQLYQRAMQEHIVPQNDAVFLTVKRKKDIIIEKNRPRPIFSQEDIEVLKAHDSDDTVKLILILIYSGFRIAELMTLERDKVNLDGGYMVSGEKTEAGIDRLVPIHPVVESYVRYFLEKATDSLFVSGYAGNKLVRNFREREFYPTLLSLGINDARNKEGRLKPHAARRTFATMAVRSGIKPEHLKKIIGHAQYDTTLNYYAQMSPSDLIKSMTQIGDEEEE